MARSRDVHLKAKREGMARLRAQDPETARRKQRDWHANNRDSHCETMRAYYARRFFWGRAMKLRGPDRATYRELASLWKSQRGRCALTGRRLDRSAQIDHKIAKARGGTDSIGNLQWVCRAVNLARRDLPHDEFIALCADVLQIAKTRAA